MALIHCPECSTQVSQQAQACPKCAYPINKLNFRQTEQNKSSLAVEIDLSGLDDYYVQEFEKIYSSQENYRGKFNWWGFFFSWIWCFFKGAWAWAIIILVANIGIGLILSFLNTDLIIITILKILFSIGIAVTFGHNATMIFYNVKTKNKQI